MKSPEELGLSSRRLARIIPTVNKHIGDDKVVGAVTLLFRKGEIVHLECFGMMDRERKKPMIPDAIFRIYSMTKPITSVALMMLYEQGHFQLFDPVAKFIPAFNDLKVYAGGGESDLNLVDLQRPVTIRDLLAHTSGLTYPFLEYSPVEALYRQMDFVTEMTLAEFVAGILEFPLAFQPGSSFRYGTSHDVVAYLVEIMSGQPLDVFLKENLFEPLGMMDTGFSVAKEKLGRFAALYGSGDLMDPGMTVTKWYGDADKGIHKLLADPMDCLESRPHKAFRGGHGLVSTAPDYLRFCQMMLNRGVLDGQQLLGRKTVEVMTANHLLPALLPYEIGGTYSPGYGCGLGFSVLMDIGQCQTVGSEGEFGWGGAASTDFWINPKEDLIGIQMAQFMPKGYHLINQDFRVAAYQSIID